MKNIISIIGLLIVATSAIDDVIAIESSSKPTAMKDNNQLIRRRKTKSAKSSDSGDGGGDSDTSDVIAPFIEDTPDDDASISMSMSMPGGVDDPFIGLADSDASMSIPDIDSSESTEEEEEEESVVAYGDTKDGATTDQWHALVSTLDATHESYTPPDADASVEEDESDSTPPSRADSPWHALVSTLDATHESYTPPPAESVEDTAGEDAATASVEEEMSMSSTTASSMSMPPGDGREDEGGGSSKARKLSTAHDTANIHGRITKIGLTRMKTKMDDELPWGDDSSMSMSVPIRASEADIDNTVVAADTEVPSNMPNSKSSKGKTWKTKSAKAKSSKLDDHVISMPHSKSGKAKSSKRV